MDVSCGFVKSRTQRKKLVFLGFKMMLLGEDVNTLKVIDSSLRLCVVPLSLGSMWLTLTNHQNNEMYGKIEFSNIKGLKFLVSISAISAGCPSDVLEALNQLVYFIPFQFYRNHFSVGNGFFYYGNEEDDYSTTNNFVGSSNEVNVGDSFICSRHGTR
uniref:CASP-like protein n=1 Tax=Lactuca sativa TaxID=4236 RepID=A0A9R1VKR1_LACSA|nr:hypothetical protein LSAT_V11C500291830 [Lactuca sativa]